MCCRVTEHASADEKKQKNEQNVIDRDKFMGTSNGLRKTDRDSHVLVSHFKRVKNIYLFTLII